MMAGLKDWWAEQTARERFLILAAIVLVSALALQFLVVTPMRENRARAQSSYESAMSTLAEIRAGAALARSQNASASRERTAPENLRAMLTAAAARRGILINRVQPTEEGVDLRIDDADPEALYAWLYEMTQERNVRIRRASVRHEAGGAGVRASFLISAG